MPTIFGVFVGRGQVCETRRNNVGLIIVLMLLFKLNKMKPAVPGVAMNSMARPVA